jgi:SAM-dependent methyltransferase
MPTIEQNKLVWDVKYNWDQSGEDWSQAWGSSDMQWHGAIMPRIHSFLPANMILEIAPGFGRWTKYLKGVCSNLIVVDLSEKCIKACQERFNNCSHITYFINDGKSLDMIPDDKLDLIFSFDSLVHVEDSIISTYLSQFSRKLTKNGAAFIHHSNLGEYPRYIKILSILNKIPKLLGILTRMGIIDNFLGHWRAHSMTAKKMQLYAKENGLQCISQELITWITKRVLIDCISIIVKRDSIWFRDNKVLKNPSFMKEAKYLSRLSQLYNFRVQESMNDARLSQEKPVSANLAHAESILEKLII